MELATYQEFKGAKSEILEGKKYVEHREYCCEDGSRFYEITDDGMTEFWSTADTKKRCFEQPGRGETKRQEEIIESRQKILRRIYKLVYWFVSEMLEEEDAEEREAQKFKKQCEEESEKFQFRISAHDNNIGVLKSCIRDAHDVVEFFKEEQDVEEWQLAGINAMFDQCNKEKIVPYDLPTAIKGLLCLHIRCRHLCIEEAAKEGSSH